MVFCCFMHGTGIQWNGYLQTDNRIRLLGENDFSWHEYRLDLRAELSPSKKTHFYSDLWIRSLGFPEINSSIDLADNNLLRPLNLDLREVYVDLYGLIVPDLDIRLGRQRIAWGTGDKINPTDNLNPYDLEDIWDFGRHLGSDGLLASLYVGDYTMSAVLLPMFTPAVLPAGEWASLLSEERELLPGITIGNTTDSIIMPDNNFRQTFKGGLKIKRRLMAYDLSLSYVYGLDDLPIATRVKVVPAQNIGEVDIHTELIYPKMHIFGFDIAGALGSVGVWGEAAMFLPDEIKLTTDLSELGMGVQESIALDNKSYVKFLIGTDYTFANSLYLNLQYLRGFVHERGSENLANYLLFGSEWLLFGNKIKIMPVAGAFVFAELDDIADNNALVYTPEISYLPIDNAILSIGTRLIQGNTNTIFGQFKDYDEIYFRMKYSF
jgi:hypothetical protein